jgi:THO complex subunit 5
MDPSPSIHPVLTTASLALTPCLAILDLLSTPNPSDQTDHLLSTHRKTLTTHLAHLRRLNRSAIHSVRTTKTETAHARQEIDALHLQLQNLYYEQRHLRGEIAGCENYELVPTISTHPAIPLTDLSFPNI